MLEEQDVIIAFVCEEWQGRKVQRAGLLIRYLACQGHLPDAWEVEIADEGLPSIPEEAVQHG